MRIDRVVQNGTQLATAAETVDWIDGREVVAVIAKASFDVDDQGRVRLPLHPTPVRRSAMPRTVGTASGLRYPSDVAPYKPGCEVLLAGTAVPPSAGVTRMTVSLRVGAGERLLLDKTVEVHGPRVWQQGMLGVAPGPAGAVVPTELCWENAYGGLVVRGGEQVYDKRNPVGSGVAFEPRDRIGKPAPPIEDPRAPLSSRAPAPAGFGPLQTGWDPRARRFGTADESWARERRPLLPLDFDPRFYCAAPDDQWLAEPLAGGEIVEVVGVRPGKPWLFRLPSCRPRFVSRAGGVETSYRPELDTVLIDAERGRVELSWRIAVPLPKKSEKLEWVRVGYEQPLDDALLDDLADRHRAALAS